MWFKLLLLLGAVLVAEAAKPPRKLSSVVDDELQEISPLTDPFDGINYRLPNTTRPIRYDVWLSTEIHLADFDFTGRVTIQILVLENTNSITLHHRQITITQVNLASVSGQVIQANVPFTLHPDTEFMVITPSQRLEINQLFVLEIMYLGELRNDDAGFYRSSYTDAQGQTKWLATTQFESTDARHAFPCFDEPGIRSRFSIEIRHHNSLNAISNMPEASRTVQGEYLVTKFTEMPSVQTYLIAFTVSEFTFVDSPAEFIPQRVFGRPQAITNGEGALAIEVSGHILRGFEDYLSVNFSLPKMDQAAIPDFAAGAMENWGLVTYAENALLYNPITDTARNRENVIGTIAHEFAHQWFGNLVSPAWWSFLWMNEGFATLYADYLLEVAYPGERWADTFLVETVQAVMESDSNPTVRPMSYYVESPERIDRLFDNVAYSKSGSVLRMFLNVFGEATWKKGLQNYLEARSYNLAIPDHLYEGIQAAVTELDPTSTVNVAAVMKSWETQSGFPYITLSRDGDTLIFIQNRFLFTERTSPNVWWVPINYVVSTNPDFSSTKPDMWMEGVRSLEIRSSEAPKAFTADTWIVVNAQQSSYYRVNYDVGLWQQITKQLNDEGTAFDKIHRLNRAQLIDDSFHLARAGLLGFDTTFGIMNYLEKETDYIPWTPTNRANTLLNRWLTGTAVYPHYQTFMRKNVEALFTRLGTNIVNNEQRVDRYARTVAINIACQAQLDACLTQTTQALQTMINSGSAMAPDLIVPVYCNGLRKAGEPLFTAMKNKMLQSKSQAERNTIIASLGCTQDTTLLASFLGLVVDSSVTLTNNERSRILSSPINYGEASVHELITFAIANQAFLGAQNLVSTMCANIAARIHSNESLEHFAILLRDVLGAGFITAAQASSYRSTANTLLTWQNENLDQFKDIFEVNDDGTTTTTTLGAGSIVLSTAILSLCVVIKHLL